MEGLRIVFDTMLSGFSAIGQTIVTTFEEPFNRAFEAITSIFSVSSLTAVGQSIVDGIINGISGLGGAIMEVANQAWNDFLESWGIASPSAEGEAAGGHMVDGIMGGMDSLGDELSAAGQGAVEDMATGMGADGTGTQAMIDAVIDPISQAIDTVMQAQNNVHEILNALRPIDLDATITRVGEELAVKNKTVAIQHKPVNVTVNLNVTMSAEEVAEAMVEAKLVQQGSDYTPPGQ